MGAAAFARALHNTRAPVQSPHLSPQSVFVDGSIAANFIFLLFFRSFDLWADTTSVAHQRPVATSALLSSGFSSPR